MGSLAKNPQYISAMLSNLQFLLFPLATMAQISTTCEWYGASYGVNINCLPGWVSTGMCGSGRYADCTDERGIFPTTYYYMLQCCQTKYQNYGQSNCQTTGYGYGALGVCASGQAHYGGCGSGNDLNCKVNGNSYCFSNKCCDNGDITLGDSSFCDWKFGVYGTLLECPSGYAAAGYCGSGSYADCTPPSGGSKTYTGVYCCPYTDNKN